MIISKTPLRISFFGGGTDYPSYYEKYGGEVLSTSIDQYVYVTVSKLNPLFEHKIRVAYSKTELVRTVDEIQHPSVRHCLRHLGIKEGVEVSVTTDLPARTGLGSSSAFTVGLLHALYACAGRMISQEDLAREAIHVEQRLICERVGSQDQVAAALGGFRRIAFAKDNLFRAEPVPVSPERRLQLQSHLLLFFTGITRLAEEVLQDQASRVEVNGATLEAMRSQVAEACRILCSPERSLSGFGELLHEGWRMKRALSARISNALIDDAYAKARAHGAVGGKLLGAGGGGFLLIFAPPERHEDIRRALAPLVSVPFAFEQDGSRLIYYRPQAVALA